jgi:hypothetical protein
MLGNFSADQRFDPRGQFARRKRLGNVVIGTLV